MDLAIRMLDTFDSELMGCHFIGLVWIEYRRRGTVSLMWEVMRIGQHSV